MSESRSIKEYTKKLSNELQNMKHHNVPKYTGDNSNVSYSYRSQSSEKSLSIEDSPFKKPNKPKNVKPSAMLTLPQSVGIAEGSKTYEINSIKKVNVDIEIVDCPFPSNNKLWFIEKWMAFQENVLFQSQESHASEFLKDKLRETESLQSFKKQMLAIVSERKLEIKNMQEMKKQAIHIEIKNILKSMSIYNKKRNIIECVVQNIQTEIQFTKQKLYALRLGENPK